MKEMSEKILEELILKVSGLRLDTQMRLDAVNLDRHPREDVLHEDSKEEDINKDDGDKSRGDLHGRR